MKNRIKSHPILEIVPREEVTFYWKRGFYRAYKGEMISAALIANGVNIFGHHHKDDTTQAIFCANGQCSKCMVLVNGKPKKACMTEIEENMVLDSVEGLPSLPFSSKPIVFKELKTIETEVLIIGGGPAGLSAAIELGKYKIKSVLVDDKKELGGKLVLQTHKFFGSVEDSFAGSRGIDIGKKLAEQVNLSENVEVWINSTVLYVFKDKKVGILKNGEYCLVHPRIILNTAGAREKFLRFSGNNLAGIYGAGAFQTLVNRDLVKSSNRLFIVGGGNVGLIAGYHALQAGIEVIGLIEAMPACSGYKVHSDKLKRLGVPIYTSHTIFSANGTEEVNSITIAEIDKNFQIINGTEKTFACDTILIAVGLDPINEFSEEALVAGIKIFSAGDAEEIAEASSAMFNGKIIGLRIVKELKSNIDDIPEDWYEKAKILKSHPGSIFPYQNTDYKGIFPVFHCLQEIPCNPCTSVCPTNSIKIIDNSIIGVPYFEGSCIGCSKCLHICPGLAITLIDSRSDPDNPLVSVPYEISNYYIKAGDYVEVNDIDAFKIGVFKVEEAITNNLSKTRQIKIKIPKEHALKVASFKIQTDDISDSLQKTIMPIDRATSSMICLCERINAAEVLEWIRKGIVDINQLKAITRLGMGACGSKTCDGLLKQLLRQEGINIEELTFNTRRPVFVETSLEKFAFENKNLLTTQFNNDDKDNVSIITDTQ